jgi:hypothetical protein
MYIHDSITFQVAGYKRQDLLAESERARLARQARLAAPKSQPRASRRSARQLVRQLRPQAQS